MKFLDTVWLIQSKNRTFWLLFMILILFRSWIGTEIHTDQRFHLGEAWTEMLSSISYIISYIWSNVQFVTIFPDRNTYKQTYRCAYIYRYRQLKTIFQILKMIKKCANSCIQGSISKIYADCSYAIFREKDTQLRLERPGSCEFVPIFSQVLRLN